MKFTVDMIESWGPCDAYTHGLIVSLIGDGKTEKEIAVMDIPIEDRIWALIQGLSSRDQRLFACDCADRPHLLPHQSSEAKEAIRVARLYAVGGATEEELEKARLAALCGNGGGNYTAFLAANRSANRSASWAAHWAADWAADWAAERKWQIEALLGYYQEEEKL
jgi:hypothetical protein